MSIRPAHVLAIVAAAAGLVFASVSTFDFVQRLDRQVHDLHCSFVPGLGAADGGTDSGCYVTLMSPYSSVLRKEIWGGIPISLPAVSMFAFLLYRGIEALWRRPVARPAAALADLLGWCVPVAASLVMGTISIVELGAACKLCIGIYGSSTLGFVAALLNWSSEKRAAVALEQPATSNGSALLVAAGLGATFLALPLVAYASALPDYQRYIGTCGELKAPADPYGVMVSLGDGGNVPVIEVYDPLCSACRGFEHRLEASGLRAKVDRKALLFPLDSACNWMLSEPVHPGACAISEAVLCAAEGGSAREVVHWAFEQQDAIREAEKSRAGAAADMVAKRFPALGKCLGSAAVKSKLNRSLRWAVTNEIPLLTPQIYVDGKKMCDEDTDLGMDFALTRMLERRGGSR